MQPKDSNVASWGLNVSKTASSTSTMPPRVGAQATRKPRRSAGAMLAKAEPSAYTENKLRASGPLITDSKMARSSTGRPNDPRMWSVGHANCAGASGARPGAGRSPTMLQNEAGLRRDTPKSLPSHVAAIPVMRLAAEPPDEPPAARSKLYGFLVAPNNGLKVLHPVANSGTFVFPMVIAPALRILAAVMSSWSGTWCL
jgi:hypothetical protein